MALSKHGTWQQEKRFPHLRDILIGSGPWTFQQMGRCSLPELRTTRSSCGTWQREHRALRLRGHTDAVLSVSFLSDGTLASKSNGGTVKLWDVTTQSQISTFDTDANIGRGVAFSPNGPFLASRSRYAIKLWDLETGTQTGSLNHMRDYPWATLAFSPDGTILAVSANGLIEIWGRPDKRVSWPPFSGGPGGVGELLFSPDGTQLVSTGKVKFWDVSEWTTSQTTVCDRTPQVQTAILGVLQLQNPGPGTCGEDRGAFVHGDYKSVPE